MNRSFRDTVLSIADKVLSGGAIDRHETTALTAAGNADLIDLFAAANRVREHFRGRSVDICSIVNARSGACSEDCRYCAQSSRYHTDAPVYPLIDVDRMAQAAQGAKDNGAGRFCIVTSGRGIDDAADLRNIAKGVERVRDIGLSPCATLGTLTHDQLRYLKDAGLHRYHHNVETSREYFPKVCTTHTFDERIELLHHARDLGLSSCSGGILGMGETMQDRISMAFILRELDVDSVPINFLMPVPGTPLAAVTPITPLEALHAIALFRLILPKKEIRVCGGRGSALGDLHPLIFLAGADGFMIGNYLTRTGLDPKDDLRMITDMGLSHSCPD
jgi:biotin synthase